MSIKKITTKVLHHGPNTATLESKVSLDDGIVGIGAVKIPHVCKNIEKKNNKDCLSDLDKAVAIVQEKVGPLLHGRHADVVTIDSILLNLDSTDTKEYLGAQVMFGVSLAIARAQATASNIELYELIAYLLGLDTVILPLPFFTILQRNTQVTDNRQLRRFLLVPLGADNFKSAYAMMHKIHPIVQENLKKKYARATDMQILDYLSELVSKPPFKDSCKIALDISAGDFFDETTKMYAWHKQLYQSHEMIDIYSHIMSTYPVCSLEDGLHQSDIRGWQALTEKPGQFIQVAGREIFGTTPQKIYERIDQYVANAVVINPYAIGTLTEVLQAMQLCKDHHLGVIVTDEGMPEDLFSAELAIGSSAGQVKLGMLTDAPCIAKTQYLMDIEHTLMQLSDGE